MRSLFSLRHSISTLTLHNFSFFFSSLLQNVFMRKTDREREKGGKLQLSLNTLKMITKMVFLFQLPAYNHFKARRQNGSPSRERAFNLENAYISLVFTFTQTNNLWLFASQRSVEIDAKHIVERVENIYSVQQNIHNFVKDNKPFSNDLKSHSNYDYVSLFNVQTVYLYSQWQKTYINYS